MKRLIIILMVVISVLLLFACDTEKEKTEYNKDYSVGVIETTEQKNRSRLTFYDIDLAKVNSIEYNLGSMGSYFYPPKVFDNYMYVVPQGIGNRKEKTVIFELNLETGETKEYDMGLQNMNSFCITDKYIFGVATWNHTSIIARYDKNLKEIKTLEFSEIFIELMEPTDDNLMAFGGSKVESYLYKIDIEKLRIEKEYNIIEHGLVHEGAVVIGDDLYFTNTTKQGDGKEDLENDTMSVFHMNDETFEKIQLESDSPSHIIEYNNKLFIVHCNLVIGEGNEISIYDIETKEIELIELGHNVCQIEIQDNILYAIDYEKNLYKYILSEDKLELENQVDLDTTEGEKEHFYIGGFFKK
ncbi:hypothetical protein GOQ27_14615 [Clostridium sp. D2Q-11]|uniref:Lipoprotein n=1 Tax=Anaeromonas frigoriresistens TaxID=2683708 RepID=A0A942UZK6_9FIRM|nr:hypothetical protein [Anaeromonas frigoriresistens]MBS4539704.1 hypothetical protein [Anaeromonas frigoriresistens]